MVNDYQGYQPNQTAPSGSLGGYAWGGSPLYLPSPVEEKSAKAVKIVRFLLESNMVSPLEAKDFHLLDLIDSITKLL